NCNKFHFVQQGQTCDTIAALYSISTAQFTAWNATAKSDCTGLWSSTDACVGIIGGTPAPTATVGANRVSTPLPTQSGMVSNCIKFVRVNPSDTCNIVSFHNGPIATENSVVWNGGVKGMACTNFQAGTFAFIGVKGHSPLMEQSQRLGDPSFPVSRTCFTNNPSSQPSKDPQADRPRKNKLFGTCGTVPPVSPWCVSPS
ncbi:hypothetical protein C8A05DRAFT_19150, partial [Staphylotrichum tortipilum]